MSQVLFLLIDLNHLVVDFDLNRFGAIDFDLIYKSFFYDFDFNTKLSDQLQHWL